MIVIIRVQPPKAASWLAAKCSSCYSVARSLGVAATVLALFSTTTTDVPAAMLRPTPAPLLFPDPRIARLSAFFRAYHCPAPHHIEDYLNAADNYGLDYRLLPAISIRETTCGVTEKENNRWGYHPGRQTFPSIEVGIDFVARQLAENPVYMGKTLNGKLFTYNPRQKYPVEVQQIMRQIE